MDVDDPGPIGTEPQYRNARPDDPQRVRHEVQSHAVRAEDMQETQEHVDALEEAIEWCNHNKATVRFGDDYVYIQVKRGNRSILYGAPSFLQAVEDVAEGRA